MTMTMTMIKIIIMSIWIRNDHILDVLQNGYLRIAKLFCMPLNVHVILNKENWSQ